MTCLSLSNSWVTHSIPLFTLSSPFLAHLCAITFRMSYSRDVRGSKQVDGLLRLTLVRCCLSAVPAEYPLLQALPGFVRLPSLSRLRFATWPRLLSAFGTRLAVKPVISGLKSATCSALRSHAERLPLNPKSKVSLVFSFTAHYLTPPLFLLFPAETDIILGCSSTDLP
jgi:hypothetical protein